MEDRKPLIPVKELAKRYAIFIISLFISAMGVAITKKGELGVSPISSVANVMSEKFTFLTLGSWLIIWNCVLILGQILILRKKFQWIQLIQIPPRHVDILVPEALQLCVPAADGASRHGGTQLRYRAFRHRECRDEFR